MYLSSRERRSANSHLRSTFFLLASGAAWLSGLRAAEFDVVIRNGRVLDGLGQPAIAADVAVSGDRIAFVGTITGRGRVEIDARDRVVAPGFIDVHTHAENLDELPAAENFIRMGVTTIVTGNCGSSKTNVAEFFDTLTRTGVTVNVATLIGQGSVRAQVMGGSFMRPATIAEREKMREMVATAMQDGAVGMSTGLIYLPGTFTKTDELIELARVVAHHGGIYASHMRHENTQIHEALDELLTIAREARIRAQVSHIKLSGPSAWGQADKVLQRLAQARAEGLDVMQDQYAYTASSTGIATLVPSSAREGGTKAFLARIADPDERKCIIDEMRASLRKAGRTNYAYAVIAHFEPDPRLAGKTVPQAAKLVRGSDSLDDQIELIFDITARGGAQGVFHGMDESDLRKFMQQPETMFASDSGPRRFAEGIPHPRGYGNNARVLGRYVREAGLLTWEEAIRRMTSLPAQTFRLKERGTLAIGAIADIVVFDPASVAAPSTFEAPHRYAVGFSDVLVNGVAVIRAGELTSARPGRPVRLTK